MNPATALRLRADLGLAFIALIWGSTFVLVKEALEDVSTVLFLALRFGLATAVLTLFFHRRYRAISAWKPEIQAGIAAGAFLYTGYLLQTLGLRHTTPSRSAFLTGLYIVLVPLLAALVYRKAPRSHELFGVLMATIGMGLMTLEPGALRIGYGDMLTIACALAFAVHILMIGHYSGRVSFEGFALMQLGASALFASATFWWAEKPAVLWSGRVVIAVTATAIFATALAFALQSWAQQYTTPSRTALIFALEPVFAGLTSFLFLKEVFTSRAVAGAALILAGIIAVELRPPRPVRHASTQLRDCKR